MLIDIIIKTVQCVLKIVERNGIPYKSIIKYENNANPDLTTFNTIMKSWANSRCMGAGKASEHLQR